MNLFDMFEGREPYQQAIDKLEARRIEDLEAKMDDLHARSRKALDDGNAELFDALRQEFMKAKAERDSYHKVNVEEAPGAETLAHNQSTDASNLKALGMAENFISDTNYTYTVFIDGTKEGTYGSQEEARAVVRRKKEVAPGRDYRIKPKARTSAASIKRFQKNRDRNLDESAGKLTVSPHDAGMHAALKGKPYESNPYPKGSKEHLEWSKGHNAMRARKAQDLDEHGGGGGGPAQWHAYVRSHRTNEDELDEHGGGVNGMKDYISWRKKANTERGITKAPPPVGKSAPSKLPTIPKGTVHGKLDQSRGVVPKAAFEDQDDLIKVEGWQDFNKVEPYEVCLAGKPIKTFDYYEDARRFHDNWKKKLYNQGEKEKADKITLNPIMKEEEQKPGFGEFPAKQEIKIIPPKKLKSGETYQDRNKYWQSQGQAPIYNTNEAGNPAQQAAIAIAKKKEQGVTEDTGSWIVYDPKTKQIKKRFKTHTAGKSYAKVHNLGFASSEYYFDNVKTVDEESMAQAAHNPDGPKFGGYYKGTQIGAPKPGQSFGAESEEMEEGIAGNMTARSNPLTQPLRARNFVAKNAIQSGAGKHANQLKKAAAAGRHAKHKGQLELDESDNFLTWAVRNGFEITKPAIYESAKQAYAEAIVEATKIGNRVKIVTGAEAGQTGTIGEIRPGAFKGAPGYYTVDLDNGSHIQVRKEALRLIKNEVTESLRKGEYYIWTVYFDDGTSKRIKVTSDEFDPYEYYAKQNKVVVNVDYDWAINN